ncbi:MAG TPA: phosphoribosylamine--glycine ligase [Thermoplasmata archaeon]|nr:phosphoribosylamine--glycine ligase [Thermoplasmata archaeon]
MKVLVVGGGGREHAIVDALRRGGADVLAAMSNQNPGIRRAAVDVLLGDVTEVDRVATWAKERAADLAVIGPEAPLERGITDALEGRGIPTVGPSRSAAQLETNKEFTRRLMRDFDIPGLPAFWAFDALGPFEEWVNDADIEFVIKPLGLTGGKGVRVWGDHIKTKGEALAYGREILERRIGGAARFLVEEKLVGEEFSLQALCDGKRLVFCPLAQDHKRAYEGDRGPNTGGMGSYSDADHRLPFVTASDWEQAAGTMRRTVEAMASNGTPFKGILYGGFMNTADGPKLLEYNVRFADPESMNVLPILEDPLPELCARLVEGRLPEGARFARKATVCKYIVPMGYGSRPKPGELLKVDEESVRRIGARLYYAAVDEKGGHLYTTTSRSLAVVGIADDLGSAEAVSEEALAFVSGSFYARRDIGKPDLVARKAERMRELRRAPRPAGWDGSPDRPSRPS